MKTIKSSLITLLLLFLFSNSFFLYSQEKSWTFLKHFRGIESGSTAIYNNEPNQLEFDSKGNAYLWGTYGTFAELGGEQLPSTTDNARGHFLAKFNCQGQSQWVRAVKSGQFSTSANWMQIKNDTIYIMGDFRLYWGNWTHLFDTSMMGNLGEINRFYNYFAKFDIEGNMLSINYFQGANLIQWWYWAKNVPFYVAEDNSIYLLANYVRNWGPKYKFYIDSLPVTDSLEYDLNAVPLLFKLSPDMEVEWFRPMVDSLQGATAYWLNFNDLTTDSQGNMYYVGYAWLITDSVTEQSYPSGKIYFMDGHSMEFHTHGRWLSFIMKVNSEGTCEWVNQTFRVDTLGGITTSVFRSISINEEENQLFVSGHGKACLNTGDTFNFFPGNDTIFTPLGENGPKDVEYLASFTTEGEYLWHSTPATEGMNRMGSVEYHKNSLYVGIHWDAAFHFQDTVFSPSMTSLVKYNTDGALLDVIYNIERNDPYGLYPYDIKIDAADNIWLSGRFYSGSLDFGDTIISTNSNAIFIGRYGRECPVYVDTTMYLCYGDCFDTGEESFCQSGFYQAAITDPVEQDSIYNLTLFVLPETGSGINDTLICVNSYLELIAEPGFDSYLWSNGSTSNVYEHFYNSPGIDTVFLEISHSVEVEGEIMHCNWTETIIVEVDACVYDDIHKTAKLELYPNPAENYVTLKYPLCKKAILNLYDSSGRLLKQKQINSNSYTLPLNNLESGVYIVEVVNEHWKVTSRLMIGR